MLRKAVPLVQKMLHEMACVCLLRVVWLSHKELALGTLC